MASPEEEGPLPGTRDNSEDMDKGLRSEASFREAASKSASPHQDGRSSALDPTPESDQERTSRDPASPSEEGEIVDDDDDDDDDDDGDDDDDENFKNYDDSGSEGNSSDTDHDNHNDNDNDADRSRAPTGSGKSLERSTAPPLPDEPVPESTDDGWVCRWDPTSQAWYFANRFTGKTQWENPRVPDGSQVSTAPAAPAAPAPAAAPDPAPLPTEKPVAGGYNPAIHGDWDPNAWYAQVDAGFGGGWTEAGAYGAGAGAGDYAATAAFNRHTGQFQLPDPGPERHSDEAKSRRQMNAFFDVDAAASSHDGRSLRAERAGRKLTKAELKQYKEKRRARKEEKRRAWLRD